MGQIQGELTMKDFQELTELHKLICSKCNEKLLTLNEKREREMQIHIETFTKGSHIISGLKLQHNRQKLIERKSNNLERLFSELTEEDTKKLEKLVASFDFEKIIEKKLYSEQTGTKKEELRQIFEADVWLAASQYNPEKGYSFSTYANRYFETSMKEYYTSIKNDDDFGHSDVIHSLDELYEEVKDDKNSEMNSGNEIMNKIIEGENMSHIDDDIFALFWNPINSETLCVFCRRKIMKEISESPEQFGDSHRKSIQQYTKNIFEKRKIWLDMERSIPK